MRKLFPGAAVNVLQCRIIHNQRFKPIEDDVSYIVDAKARKSIYHEISIVATNTEIIFMNL